MERNIQYICIAFFGMINGLFNQTALFFALLHTQEIGKFLFFGNLSLTLYMASLMVSTATIILAGIPAAIFERFVGAREDSTVSSMWIWVAGTLFLTLPAMGNFFQYGL
ncbi:MAG: hypothetical protein K2P86_00835 [Xanthobacteraceae bacterium]|jgi:hypothetical protein|nr:hypothetical protein [Xanthobacteraceae bacterium]